MINRKYCFIALRCPVTDFFNSEKSGGFALANTGVVFSSNWNTQIFSRNSLGIMFGLVLGKPLGIDSEINEGDYNTLAGLILHELGYLPAVSEIIKGKDFEFEIMDMDGPKIDKVLITRK